MTIGKMFVLLCVFIVGSLMIFTGISLRRRAMSGMEYSTYGVLIYGGIGLDIITVVATWTLLNPDKAEMIKFFLNTPL